MQLKVFFAIEWQSWQNPFQDGDYGGGGLIIFSGGEHRLAGPKKAGVVEGPKAFDHAGLRFDGVPGEPSPPSSNHPARNRAVERPISLHPQVYRAGTGKAIKISK
jgi:hypothetical protein